MERCTYYLVIQERARDTGLTTEGQHNGSNDS